MFLLMFLVISLSCRFLPDFRTCVILIHRRNGFWSRCTSRRSLVSFALRVFTSHLSKLIFVARTVLPESLVPRVTKMPTKIQLQDFFIGETNVEL